MIVLFEDVKLDNKLEDNPSLLVLRELRYSIYPNLTYNVVVSDSPSYSLCVATIVESKIVCSYLDNEL